MTDQNTVLAVSDFYDRLAADYDEMTGFEKRFVKESPFFRLIVQKHAIASALDAGCGTGFHALLLSQLGLRVTAADVSNEMLARLKRHASSMHLGVRALASPFSELAKNLEGPFDAVFCLGNTLAHLLEAEDIQSALENFHALLRPDGVLYLQLLNYERILSTRERLQSVKRSGGTTYVRFYDFEDQTHTLMFNLLKLRDTDSGPAPELISVRLNPITRTQLHHALHEARFKNVNDFGSIALEPYGPDSSPDLVIESTRG
jgi:SAM-dependent methyltransferase